MAVTDEDVVFISRDEDYLINCSYW